MFDSNIQVVTDGGVGKKVPDKAAESAHSANPFVNLDLNLARALDSQGKAAFSDQLRQDEAGAQERAAQLAMMRSLDQIRPLTADLSRGTVHDDGSISFDSWLDNHTKTQQRPAAA